jgi:hypothetical protein
MGKSSTYSNTLLKLLFQNIAMANYGDASGIQPSAAAGSYYPCLFTGDPAGDDATVNECNYTGYTRAPAVARSSGGFTVSGTSASNTALVSFPACTGGTNTATFWGLATASSGAAHLPYSAPLIATFYSCVGLTADNTIRAPGHALSVNDTVEFVTSSFGSLPGGISSNTVYYVKTVSGNTLTLSATLGGATLTISSDGVGCFGKIATLAISNGITPQFLAGQLVVQEV